MVAPTTLSALAAGGFDDVIDVRSPAEFAEDHIPGAINLPVLDNEERARIGTIYKQQSPFLARKIGAAIVFRNAANHIETTLADREGGWRPLINCWRGGQRSGAFSWMLQQIGWRAETLAGGYKSFRKLVTDVLYDAPLPHRLIQLGGYTGTAKTELLTRLRTRGLQVIDLEAMARHRGSLLGGLGVAQPSQKAFETSLAFAFDALDPAHPVLVEAESSTIGAINLPPALWSAMKDAPSLRVEAPLEARAHYLARAYESVLSDHDELSLKLAPLRQHRGHAIVDHWLKLSAAGDRVGLCQALAEQHYDPSYDKAMRVKVPKLLATVHAPDLTENALEKVADDLAARLQRIESDPGTSSVTRPISAAS
ncbi:MAG: tRNA 2-selenouridine(34) synthase MnmH [Pseudomonadota bacterium]